MSRRVTTPTSIVGHDQARFVLAARSLTTVRIDPCLRLIEITAFLASKANRSMHLGALAPSSNPFLLSHLIAQQGDWGAHRGGRGV